MQLSFSKKLVVVTVLLTGLAVALYFSFFNSDKIDFNTQVKPIFNKKCIACHGGVKAKADFSLLFREDAMKPAKSGKYPIVPGKPGESEMIKRITHNDPDERMPYKHEALSKEEIKILKNWIKQGAEWGEHWAYIPVKEEEAPDYSDKWIRNDIDRFILQKLKKEKLKPSAEADRPTLLRRISLDLTGLPPNENSAKKFLEDNSDKAFENLVDDLLASSSYGERWTSLWLDLARYADTKGYESDQGRTIWRYRDWLIDAFNADKPYNDFLIEQVAGDLLPNPDDAKYIATAFHRNSLTNDEGGTDNEEFRTAAVMDRVNTTWSVLMGTTFNCVQCHSHPYDPFRHEEYYKFMAYFNNTRDEDTPAEYPLLRQYKGIDSAKLLSMTGWLKQNVSEERAKWYYTFSKTWQPVINSLQCDQFENAALVNQEYAGLRNNGTCLLPGVNLSGKQQILFRYLHKYNDGKWFIYLDSLNGPLLKTISLTDTKREWKLQEADIPQVQGRHDLYFKYYSPSLKNSMETGVLFDWFQFGDLFPGKGKPGYDSAYKYFFDLMYAKPETTPIMIESNDELKRTTHVFERGNWLVKGDEVNAEVPAIMNTMDSKLPNNRLGLAMWLTDKKNPLVARTMVNRLWEQLFGQGLAETLEDLGTQGISPTHRELLDHLSWKFMNEMNWSIKKLLKEIVMSATYRQDSKVNEELIQKDPQNKFYARGPRVRLSFEQLRDQALAVSGLLSKKMYGPGVMPFQPDGIWRSPYNGAQWILSKGEDQYRRAVYTYWKRSAPYPSAMTFDANAREVCVTRRINTNTPLQALTTLNDSAYLVLARGFAYRLKEKESTDVNVQIKKGYELMFYKPITENRLSVLYDLYKKSLDKFKKDTNAAYEMIGERDKNNNPETAALVVVTNAMMNLDEWVNK
jgi:Protein of unknown function (DUF1553)/Protein of unknown function (DUF1549)/Planctomycete cytochrome C